MQKKLANLAAHNFDMQNFHLKSTLTKNNPSAKFKKQNPHQKTHKHYPFGRKRTM
jgi:hypothetical protein